MTYEALLFDFVGGVATVTLNRPDSKNAITRQMSSELVDVLVKARHDPQVRALVLTGAGGAFCSGGDVRGMGTGVSRTHEERRANAAHYRELAVAMNSLDKPVIAAVDGVAFGAGFSLALLADVVLVSERARFCMAFQRIGLVPDLGSLFTLPRIVGLQRAKELVFSAREVLAIEAVRLDLALEVLPVDALLPRAMEIASSFVGASPTSLSICKQALQASLQSDLSTILDIEATGQAIASGSEYAKESVRRFGAKEPAQFRWPEKTSD